MKCAFYVLLLQHLCAAALAQQPNNDPAVKVKPVSEKLTIDKIVDLDALINSLASHNTRPLIIGGRPQFPNGYDFKEQVRIDKNLSVLLAVTEDAWPYLVKHLDDNRYAFTIEYGNGLYNFSISDVCKKILENTLEAQMIFPRNALYKSQVNFRLFKLPEQSDKAQLKGWLAARSQKNIEELQIEYLEQALKQSKEQPLTAEEKKLFSESVLEAIAGLKRSKELRIPNRLVPFHEATIYTKDNSDREESN